MKAIVAVDNKWGIGKDNDLLFSIPEDMAFFRSKTLNKIVVMGKNTLLSFPSAKPLKNRVNIVYSSTMDKRDDCFIANDFNELISELKSYPTDDVYIIGGARFYATMLEYCSEILVTKVDSDGKAEVFFPNLDELKEWECVYSSEDKESNGYKFKFTTYKNNNIKKL